jgi:hypothetical protein
MTAELTPTRAAGAPTPASARGLLAVLGVALGASALFWSPLLLGGALHGHDWSSHHFHYFDWVRQAFAEYRTLPLYMVDAWVTPNFIANAEAPTLGPLSWLLLVLPTGAYVKLLIVVFGAAGLAGSWLLLRDLGISPALTALVACAHAWSGFFVSHIAVGHHWAMGAYLLPALLWLARRALLGSDGALIGAALLNAFTILGGQHQPFVWQNLWLSAFALLWAVRVKALFPLTRWALVLLLTAGLGALKLAPLWLEFRDYAPTARIQGLPLASLLASLTSRGQGPELVDPAIAYQHGAGWWEYAFYLGPVALVCLVAGLAATRRVWPLLAIGLFFLALSLEPLGLWPYLEGLPVWRSQRCPARFLVLALFALLVAAAPGLERLRAWAAARRPRAAAALVWSLALVAGADLWLESRAWQAAGVGPAIESRDHRPRPERLNATDAVAELASFAPNRLSYRVEAGRPTRIVLPLRFGRRQAEWQVQGARPWAEREWLALELAAGAREVQLAYRPPGLRSGSLVSAATVVAVAAWLGWRARRRGGS